MLHAYLLEKEAQVEKACNNRKNAKERGDLYDHVD